MLFGYPYNGLVGGGGGKYLSSIVGMGGGGQFLGMLSTAVCIWSSCVQQTYKAIRPTTKKEIKSRGYLI